MSAAQSATTLIREKQVPVIDIIGFLTAQWDEKEIRQVFRRAYKEYHSQMALDVADAKGYIDEHLRIYLDENELPGYVIGIFHYLS